ncbi:MAG: prepilin-type N-terminal cleavage/methylation domain-containing protein [Gammaproteobacteria bacterium]|nr:prepilin-type N-terminal cleavage/methylation domain-containing protein [Gammaproteobacteria bacterium]
MSSTRSAGFTLIELIMVLVVLAALSVIAYPRFIQQSDFDSFAFTQELTTAIRFANKLSIASGCPIRVAISANSYALHYPDNTDGNTTTCDPPTAFGSNPVINPNKPGNYTGTTSSGVTMTGFGDFYFGTSGEPSNAGTITVNPGNRQIIIHPLTGFIQ